MYRLARTFFDGPTHAWEIALWDRQLSAHQDAPLKLLGYPVRRVGKPSARSPMPCLLPTRVELSALDEGEAFASALQGRPDTDFLLAVKRDGQAYFSGPVGMEDEQRSLADQVKRPLRLLAYDGLALLQNILLTGSERPQGIKSLAGWLYQLLSKIATGAVPTRGLHTYTSWDAAGQTGEGLGGLFAYGADLVEEAARQDKSAWQLVEELLLGCQLMLAGGEWHVVERALRVQPSPPGGYTDAPEGTDPASRPLRVELTDEDLVGGGDGHGSKPLEMDPAASVKISWPFEQKAFINGTFDSEKGALFGWGASSIEIMEEGQMRHDSASDRVVQYFDAPPLEGSRLKAEATFYRADDTNQSSVRVAQLLYHDLESEQTYSLGQGEFIENGRYEGVWEAGTDAWMTLRGAFDGDTLDRVFVLPALPGSGAGRFELASRFEPDPDGDGTPYYSHMDLHELSLTPEPGFREAVYTIKPADAGRDVSLRSPLGSLDRSTGAAPTEAGSNATARVLRTDASGSLARDFDAGSSERQSFLSEGARKIASQQAVGLRGVDLLLKPGAPDVSALSTPVYEGVEYAPIYEEERIGRGTKRLVAYELRSDSVEAPSVRWAPVGRFGFGSDGDGSGSGGGDTNEPPAASFEVAVDHGAKEVSVDASGSVDLDGTIESYVWDWGDGSPEEATGATAEHTYDQAGTYEITLTVTDDDGASDSYPRSATIDATPPSAQLVVTAQGNGTAEADSSGSSDANGQIVRRDYDWGDGDDTLNGDATERHTYLNAGTYTVTVTVTDEDGLTAQADDQVTVEESGLGTG